ncbi:MAG: reverse transcriptase domain-containing protein [Bacteroidota bacterium]
MMEDLRIVRCGSDCTIFVKGENETYLIVAVYVDDLLMMGSEKSIGEYKQKICEHLEVKFNDKLTSFLGSHLSRDITGFSISQTKKIKDLLRSMGMENCTPVRSPMVPHSYRGKGSKKEDKQNESHTPMGYRNVVGTLNHLANFTRPDLAYSVSQLSKALEKPTPTHWIACKRVLRYLRQTMEFGQKIGKTLTERKENETSEKTNDEKKEKFVVEAYADASWGDPAEKYRSVSGVVKVNGQVVSWKSKVQTCIAMSTAEAEYDALTQAVKEVRSVLFKLKELKIVCELPVKVYSDNTAAIKLSEKTGLRSRTKHVGMRLEYVREAVNSGDIEIVHIPTDRQPADVLTKALPGDLHQQHLHTLACELFGEEEACES